MSSASFDVLVAVRLESAGFCFDVAELLVDICEVFVLVLKRGTHVGELGVLGIEFSSGYG